MAGCCGEPMTRFLLAAFGAVVLSGCGASGGSSFCDFRQGSSNGPEPRCQERVNTISAEVLKFVRDDDEAEGVLRPQKARPQ